MNIRHPMFAQLEMWCSCCQVLAWDVFLNMPLVTLPHPRPFLSIVPYFVAKRIKHFRVGSFLYKVHVDFKGLSVCIQYLKSNRGVAFAYDVSSKRDVLWNVSLSSSVVHCDSQLYQLETVIVIESENQTSRHRHSGQYPPVI